MTKEDFRATLERNSYADVEELGRRVYYALTDVSDAYADPKQKNPRLVVVDLEARERLARPVSLDEIKKQAALKNFDLVRLPRLSVMPVSEAQWNAIMKLAKK